MIRYSSKINRTLFLYLLLTFSPELMAAPTIGTIKNQFPLYAISVPSIHTVHFAHISQNKWYASGDCAPINTTWINVVNVNATQDMRKNSLSENIVGYTAHSNGLSLGFEQQMTPKWVAGIGYAYSEDHYKSPSPTLSFELYNKSHHTLLYSRYNMCNCYYHAQFSVGLNQYQQKQTDGPVVKLSDFNAWQMNSQLEAGYDWHRKSKGALCTAHLIPYVFFDHTHLRARPYEEVGSVRSYITNAPMTQVALGIGGKFLYEYRWGNCVYAPYVNISNMRYIVNSAQQVSVSGVGLNLLDNGLPPADNAQNVAVGLSVECHYGKLIAEYACQRKAGYRSYAAFLHYELSW